MKSISFPKKEISGLKKRLTDKKHIFTLRVSNEQGKYKSGQILQSNLGEILKVVKVETIGEINSYKYIKELSHSQLSKLKRYNLLDVLELKKIILTPFSYFIEGKKQTIYIKECKSIWSKFSGLMFRKNSPPLLFPFSREQKLSIHSLFCKPFKAIWLDKNKKSTKSVDIFNWQINFSGKGKYLLEIPLNYPR